MIEADGSAVMEAGSVAAPCQQLAAELEGERQALADLQSELQQSPPQEKPLIAKQIRAQRSVVAAKAAELAACMNSAPRQPLIVSLAEGTLASASIPGVFRPVSLGGETYVDGGIREVLPLQAAVDLGADTIYAVSASSPDLLPASSGFGSAGIFEIIGRSLTEITIHEIATTDFSVRPRAGEPLPHIADIHPDVDIHGITTIDPGLIQINRDYGYMRAADVLDDVASQSRRYQLATEIALHRVGVWALENLHAGQPDPLRATPPPGQPRPELRIEIDAAKQALARLLDERRSLGGAMPAGIDAFSGRPELHPWLTLLNDAVVVSSSPPPNGSAPGMSVAASVTMRNTGTTTWDPALGYALGSQQPPDNTI
jgi:hypothetical protein